MKRVLVLAFAKGFNGTVTHRNLFQKLFSLLPDYDFVMLTSPKNLEDNFDLYLNLIPPYNIYNRHNPCRYDFYQTAAEWLLAEQNGFFRHLYHLIPKKIREKIAPLKFRILKRYLRSLPPSEKWITLCHDVTPVISRDWFDFHPDDEIDFLVNYRKACHIIAVSEHTKQDLIRYGVSPEKISVVYNSYDPDFSLENQGVPPKCPDYILVVGSFEPRKNAKTVYEAFQKLKEEYPGTFVFVGSDKWGDHAIYHRIKQDPRCKVIENVPQDRLIGWYHGARAVVYCSLYEGFGLPVLEAAGCGVPVVTSAKSGMLEAGEGYAEFADPLDPDDIAEKIKKVLSPSYRVNREARLKLIAKYRLEENAKRLRSALRAGELNEKPALDFQEMVSGL